MKRLISTLIVFITVCLVLQANDINFRVDVHGVRYDKLQLNVAIGPKIRQKTFDGLRGADGFWTFHIPDSVYERYYYMELIPQAINSTTNNTLCLQYKLGKDTLKSSQFCIAPQNNTLDITYINTDTIRNSPSEPGIVVYYNFMVNKADKEVEASLVRNTSSFGYFQDINYDKHLREWNLLAQKYSYSHAFISTLYRYASVYRTKADVNTLFQKFSMEQKQSYYGRLIQEYLDRKKFHDMTLPDLSTRVLDNVIPATNKKHLIVFTASWCAPCRREIPILKDIYKKYKDSLDITYISIDDTSTVKEMEQLMVDEQIPWRCLSAANNMDGVTINYNIVGVPTTFLVCQDRTYGIYSLSAPKALERFYKDLNEPTLNVPSRER